MAQLGGCGRVTNLLGSGEETSRTTDITPPSPSPASASGGGAGGGAGADGADGRTAEEALLGAAVAAGAARALSEEWWVPLTAADDVEALFGDALQSRAQSADFEGGGHARPPPPLSRTRPPLQQFTASFTSVSMSAQHELQLV